MKGTYLYKATSHAVIDTQLTRKLEHAIQETPEEPRGNGGRAGGGGGRKFTSILKRNSLALASAARAQLGGGGRRGQSSGTLGCFWMSILPTIWPEVIGGFQA